MAVKSQTDRVLAYLRHVGDTGTCQADWSGERVVDGGAPITRLAARIGELKDRGFSVHTVGRRHGMAVYQLDVARERAAA